MNGRGNVLKKVIFPIIFIGEWILYYYVILLVLVFNMINFTNVLYVDMAWEQPITITTSFIQLVLLVVSLSLVCFLYTKYFAGNGFYKRFKAFAWGTLFALNSLACLGYLLIWYGIDQFDLRNMELNLLLLIILASVFLTMQIITKLNQTYD